MLGQGSMNTVTLLGNMGGDPEIFHSEDGRAVARISLATTEMRHDGESGEKKKHAEWHRVVFFGNAAELLEKFGGKGRKLCIEGSLRTSHWTDANGNARRTVEIVGRSLTFIGGAREPSDPASHPADPDFALGESNGGGKAKKPRKAKPRKPRG